MLIGNPVNIKVKQILFSSFIIYYVLSQVQHPRNG